MGRKRIKALLIISLITFFALAPSITSASPADPALLRVGLTSYNKAASPITVSSASGFSITGAPAPDEPGESTESTQTISYPAGASVAFEVTASVLTLTFWNGSSVIMQAPVTLTPADSATIKIACARGKPKEYRGQLEIGLRSGKLGLVNIIDLEDYVLGVLPAEMPDAYPTEALKAQAIAVRTYALKNRGKHSSQGFDICDSQHCQVYNGSVSGKNRCAKAVMDTAGMVLTYNGQLISVLYSADCGGTTQSYAEAYPDHDIPYLGCVSEPSEISHLEWEKRYTPADLEVRLRSAGIKEAAGLKSIAVAATGPSGRVQSIEITGETGTATITGNKLRGALGYGVIKSTLFTIASDDDGTITFTGRGFGHGIGLCQTGARGLAEPPFNYTSDQILAHYFPGTQLSSLASTGTDYAVRSLAGKQADVVAAPDPQPRQSKQQPKTARRKKETPSSFRLTWLFPSFELQRGSVNLASRQLELYHALPHSISVGISRLYQLSKPALQIQGDRLTAREFIR